MMLENITALTLLGFFVLLSYQMLRSLLSIMKAHLEALQDMDKRQTILLEKCTKELSMIRKEIVNFAQFEGDDKM